MKSIVLTSDNPEALANFYRDVLQIPLEKERHRGTVWHWACQFGSLHLAIHHRNDFWLPAAAGPTAGTIVSFTIDSLERIVQHLETLHVEIVAQQNIGPMQFVALRDPDGRYVCCGTRWPSRGQGRSAS